MLLLELGVLLEQCRVLLHQVLVPLDHFRVFLFEPGMGLVASACRGLFMLCAPLGVICLHRRFGIFHVPVDGFHAVVSLRERFVVDCLVLVCTDALGSGEHEDGDECGVPQCCAPG